MGDIQQRKIIIIILKIVFFKTIHLFRMEELFIFIFQEIWKFKIVALNKIMHHLDHQFILSKKVFLSLLCYLLNF